PTDQVTALEETKDRARLLLERHGIIYRERLRDEANGFRWIDVANALRLLELSGEVLGGYFVHGVTGIQFATPEAVELLQGIDQDSDRIFWLSAADPASPAGIALDHLPYELPARQRSTVLVYRGTRLVIVVRRGGRDIDIDSDLDTSQAPVSELFAFATTAVSRAVAPLSRFVIETINGESASARPIAEALRQIGFRADHSRLVLWARYR
ncbi:MAG: ATP-dependent helicase, partial [Spirochaetes bacterium]|nr:ATP-dependent helicase [Spirochaetota bacterium]